VSAAGGRAIPRAFFRCPGGRPPNAGACGVPPGDGVGLSAGNDRHPAPGLSRSRRHPGSAGEGPCRRGIPSTVQFRIAGIPRQGRPQSLRPGRSLGREGRPPGSRRAARAPWPVPPGVSSASGKQGIMILSPRDRGREPRDCHDSPPGCPAVPGARAPAVGSRVVPSHLCRVSDETISAAFLMRPAAAAHLPRLREAGQGCQRGLSTSRPLPPGVPACGSGAVRPRAGFPAPRTLAGSGAVPRPDAR
jgi:hypothetical protein